MKVLWACVRKEVLLLRRDLHGLLLLFVMPLVFVLIMSLALQNEFAQHGGSQIKVLSVDRDGSAEAEQAIDEVEKAGVFRFVDTDPDRSTEQIEASVRKGEWMFAVEVLESFGDVISGLEAMSGEAIVNVWVSPDADKQTEVLFVSSLRMALGKGRMASLLSDLGEERPEGGLDEVRVQYLYGVDEGETPTAVQQSVPAWLVFGAFFVVVPLSNALIRERQQGTLRRLRSANLSLLVLLGGKIVPYYVVNQLQVVLMLLAGIWVVPLLGGEALQLNGSWPMLALMASALSLAALGIGLLIAVSSRTTEQATLLGGTGNIVLAALGGIMIPKFVMPESMQTIANWSPMSWGLEGFLDVLLRGGGLEETWPELTGLTLLGIVTILISWFVLRCRAD